MASTLDSPEDPSFFLCKYFVGRRCCFLRPVWLFLRDNSAPSAIFPTAFYEACLETLQKVGNSELSSKILYTKLLAIEASPPILPLPWTQVIGPGFSLDVHWSLVRDPFTENFKNDITWLITLRAVNVRDSLHVWGYIPSATCASCPRRETIDDCFLHCPRVKRVWAHFATILSVVLGSQVVVNLLTVFFFRWPSVDPKRARIARHLVKSVLYGIWTFRNKASFHNGNEDHRAIVRYISGDLKQRVSLDFIRLSPTRFSDLWLVDGYCIMENGLPRVSI